MTTFKKTCIAGLGALALLGTVGGAARAGYTGSYPVVISGLTARGSLGSARASGDSRQTIGCLFYISGPPTTVQAACDAADATGNYVSCLVPNASYFPAIQAMTANSYISFTADSNGYCSFLQIANESYLYPSK